MIVAIVNPASGSADDGWREKIAAVEGVEIRETTESCGPDEVAADAVRDGATEIWACGGDGSVMAVIEGLHKAGKLAETVVAILPAGTANLVATALGLPDDPDGAVAVATGGEVRVVDLGLSNGTPFALGIGIGLTERLVSEASSEAKKRFGKLAYAWAMVKELGARPHRFELVLDDGPPEKMAGVAVVIANTGEMGHGLTFAPNAALDDGVLDVCVLKRFEWTDIPHLGWNLLRGRLAADRAMEFRQARTVEVRANPPLEIQIDGEPVEARTPIRAEAIPKALRVRCPRPSN